MKVQSLAFFLFAGFLVYLFSYPDKVFADSPSLSLTISPPIFELLLKPGSSASQKFILRNIGQTVKVTPKILEYSQKEIDPDSQFDPDPWIEVKSPGISLNNSFDLPSNSQKEILLEVHPDSNVAESEYNRILLFTTSPPEEKTQSESLISESIGSVLLITVSKTGSIVRQAKITDFSLPLILDSFSPLLADIYLLNSGQGLIRPTGKIMISSPIFKASYSINPFTVFSGERKILKTDASVKSPHGSNTLYLPGFYLGKYDVEVSIAIGENIPKVIEKKTFYAFPWKITLLLILSGLVFLLIRRAKKQKKNLPSPSPSGMVSSSN